MPKLVKFRTAKGTHVSFFDKKTTTINEKRDDRSAREVVRSVFVNSRDKIRARQDLLRIAKLFDTCNTDSLNHLATDYDPMFPELYA